MLAVDTLPFRLKDGRGGRIAFPCSVRSATTAGARTASLGCGRPTSRPRSDWEEFLTTGPQGMPRIIVCDADPALSAALRNLWGMNGLGSSCATPTCEGGSPSTWSGTASSRASALRHAPGPLGKGSIWAAWLALAQRRRYPALLDRVDDRLAPHQGGRTMAEQITWQHSLADTPLSTGAVEHHLDWLREELKGRRHSLRNQSRTNQLLKLVQLYRNGDADQDGYAHILRHHLAEHGGHAPLRRQLCDPAGTHSLRP